MNKEIDWSTILTYIIAAIFFIFINFLGKKKPKEEKKRPPYRPAQPRSMAPNTPLPKIETPQFTEVRPPIEHIKIIKKNSRIKRLIKNLNKPSDIVLINEILKTPYID